MGGYEYEKISRMYVVGWCIDPLSIRYLLNDIYDRYQKPLFIVENGLGYIDETDENNFVNDQKRIDYLKAHFREIKKSSRN